MEAIEKSKRKRSKVKYFSNFNDPDDDLEFININEGPGIKD
jgi:hypothetical protein